MDRDYFKKLTEVAPKLMQSICNIYGFTIFEEEYYSDYLIKATKPKKGTFSITKRIEQLMNSFDANLEPLKMSVLDVIGHLEANGYIFNLTPYAVDGKLIGHKIKIHKKGEDNLFLIINESETNSEMLQYALQDASIIAAEHFENNN